MRGKEKMRCTVRKYHLEVRDLIFEMKTLVNDFGDVLLYA